MNSEKQTIVYKEVDKGENLIIDIFLPEPCESPSSQRPAIIYFFGGGWHKGTTDAFRPQCEALAKLGFVAFAPQYRTESSHGVSPQICLEDAKSAVRWIKKNLTRFNIDPQKIAIGGGSAGGHLAAACCMVEGYNDPKDDLSISTSAHAMVLYNPVLDNGPDGYRYSEDHFPAFSPFHQVRENLPPCIMFLGTEDHLIPVATLDQFAQNMEAKGNTCTLHLFEGAKHGFFNFRSNPQDRPNFDRTIKLTTEFFKDLNWI